VLGKIGAEQAVVFAGREAQDGTLFVVDVIVAGASMSGVKIVRGVAGAPVCLFTKSISRASPRFSTRWPIPMVTFAAPSPYIQAMLSSLPSTKSRTSVSVTWGTASKNTRPMRVTSLPFGPVSMTPVPARTSTASVSSAPGGGAQPKAWARRTPSCKAILRWALMNLGVIRAGPFARCGIPPR
jgi:hypothetical protein